MFPNAPNFMEVAVNLSTSRTSRVNRSFPSVSANKVNFNLLYKVRNNLKSGKYVVYDWG